MFGIEGGHEKTGISNVGNSCYINAASQLLASIPGLPEHIKNNNSEYGNFLITLRNTPKNKIDENAFITNCIIPVGFNQSQQDVYEFLFSDIMLHSVSFLFS